MPVTGWWKEKRIIGKMEGQGGGEAQGVADQKKIDDLAVSIINCTKERCSCLKTL
jgi:hypothetical protein